MDVREMKPGRELDALVAEKIFDKQFYRAPMTEWRGRYVYKEFWDDPNSYYNEWHRSQEIGEWEYCGPNYSTDISAAWEVLGKFQLRLENVGYGDKKYHVIIHKFDEDGEFSEFDSFAETAPHAICIASLLAMEDKA